MPNSDRGWVRRLAIGLGAGGVVALVLVLGARLFFASDEPAAAMDSPRFVEEAVAAGIEHVYDGDFLFFVGGGVAVFDCDEDGRPDLFLAGGVNPAALYRNESEVGGVLSFVELADSVTDLTGVTGAYPLDIDSDGHLDLSVQRVGENVLLRGLGGCRFERANEMWSFDGGEVWTVGFSAAWEGGAAFPSL
ncbi:MAG: VCBS repeat-containing protein, partial [Acidimicrobiia bacterium]|nr:VCBS repeat-containing protein [Acidimicrobiia bacterium]